MRGNFFIYFDLKSNLEIIKYRKLMKEYILESDDKELLDDCCINEDENPYHIVDAKLINEYPDINKKIFINTLLEMDTIVQPIGTFFIDFLNVNLNSVNSLMDFVFKYGLDLILNMDKLNILKSYECYSEDKFEITFNKLHSSLKDALVKIQNNFKESVQFCFQDSGDKEINLLDAKRRYFLSFNKAFGGLHARYLAKLQPYSKNIQTNFTSFYDTNVKLENYEQSELIEKVAAKDFAFVPFSYDCLKLENALFISFINLLDTNNLNINTCINCGKLFIPSSKSNENIVIILYLLIHLVLVKMLELIRSIKKKLKMMK